MHPRRFLSRFLPVLILALLAACGGQQGGTPGGGPSPSPVGQPPRGGPGGEAPSTTVEQFLRLAGRKQYLDMGWLFGTREGAIMSRDPRADVERRMFALASVLENQQFVIRDEQPIPGSVGQSVRLTVQLSQRGRTTSVPFVTVRGPGDRWFVEQVDVQSVTNPRQ